MGSHLTTAIDGASHDHANSDHRLHHKCDASARCERILTGENGLAHIRLNDQLYTLRITRAGKLILTK